MKSQRRKVPLTDLQRLAQRVADYHLPDGPFDYAARANSLNDTQEFFREIVREGRRNYADPKAKAVIESARRLYDAAREAAYPTGFWKSYQNLCAGDPAGLEAAVSFLEADPWFPNSGYVKVKLIRHIKLPMLTPSDIGRLQSVVLEMVERRNGQEFRAYCKLARKVDSHDFREQLTQRADQGDFDVRRRARWVLEALVQKDSMEQGRKKAKAQGRKGEAARGATE